MTTLTMTMMTSSLEEVDTAITEAV